MWTPCGFEWYGRKATGTFLGGELSRGSLLFPFHAVDALDHQEHGKGYDDKADDGIDEDPRLRVTAPAALAEAKET